MFFGLKRGRLLDRLKKNQKDEKEDNPNAEF